MYFAFLDIKAFLDFAKKNYDLYIDKYTVYEDLRNKKYIVRPGLKFGTDFTIYKTSISKENFYDTYCIISGILNQIIDHKLDPSSQCYYDDLYSGLQIILNAEPQLKHKASNLAQKLNIDIERVKKILKSLEGFGFILNYEDFYSYSLTDRALYFRVGYEYVNKKINNSART